MFYEQNVKQFWLPEEIALNGDLLTWKYLGKDEQDTYMKVLAGLTLLDTEQGNTGMPTIAEHVKGHQRKAVLNFMAMMECKQISVKCDLFREPKLLNVLFIKHLCESVFVLRPVGRCILRQLFVLLVIIYFLV